MKQFFDSITANVETREFYRFCPACGAQMIAPDANTYAHQHCKQCNFTAFFNPFPGVVVLILKDSQFLLGRRGDSSFRAGLWCLPGGFMELGENFLQTAHREVMEETGLQIKIRSIVNVVSNIFTPKLETLVIVLLADCVSGKEVAGDDLVELRWFSLSEPLPGMAFEADEHIIQQYIDGCQFGLPVDERYA